MGDGGEFDAHFFEDDEAVVHESFDFFVGEPVAEFDEDHFLGEGEESGQGGGHSARRENTPGGLKVLVFSPSKTFSSLIDTLLFIL